MNTMHDLRHPVGSTNMNNCKDMAAATNFYLNCNSEELTALITEIVTGKWLERTGDSTFFYGLDMAKIGVHISYQGFNPKALATKLDLMRNFEKRRQYDIALMIAISIERGNRVSKMHLASTPVFVKAIGELIATYDLKDKAAKDPTAVTLSRVAASFPHIACTYMSIATNPTVSLSDLKHVRATYPRPMMCPHFTALIPKEHPITKTFLKAHAVFHYYFTLKIANKQLKQPKISVTIINVWKYLNIAHQGSYLDMESQLVYMDSLGVISTQKGEIKYHKAVTEACKYWQDNFEKYLPVEDDDDDDSEGEGSDHEVRVRRKSSASDKTRPAVLPGKKKKAAEDDTFVSA